jgi:hypothetical protein
MPSSHRECFRTGRAGIFRPRCPFSPEATPLTTFEKFAAAVQHLTYGDVMREAGRAWWVYTQALRVPEPCVPGEFALAAFEFYTWAGLDWEPAARPAWLPGDFEPTPADVSRRAMMAATERMVDASPGHRESWRAARRAMDEREALFESLVGTQRRHSASGTGGRPR